MLLTAVIVDVVAAPHHNGDLLFPRIRDARRISNAIETMMEFLPELMGPGNEHAHGLSDFVNGSACINLNNQLPHFLCR